MHISGIDFIGPGWGTCPGPFSCSGTQFLHLVALLFPKTLEYPTGPSASEQQATKYVEDLVKEA